MFITYLLLGSNLGDSKQYLKDASIQIENRIGSIIKKSGFYQTASWGKHDQPDFVNQALVVQTNLDPERLIKAILEIESGLGRQRIEKWGSRTIDIDIMFYENQLINTPQLVVPHPFLHVRRFCLMPLSEIAPGLIHPLLNKSIKDLLDNLEDNLFVKKLP